MSSFNLSHFLQYNNWVHQVDASLARVSVSSFLNVPVKVNKTFVKGSSKIQLKAVA